MDWKNRLRNKTFWLTLVSAILTVIAALGFAVDTNYINTVVVAVLGVLTVLGVIIDPTTPGVKDEEKK